MASAYQRSNGKWAIRYRDEAGRWRSRVTTARTKAEARKLAFEAEQRCERIRLGLDKKTAPSKKTVAELMRWWLDEHSVHLRSHRTNDATIRKHILPDPLARMRATEVTSGDVSAFLRTKQAELGPKTLNHLRGYLHGAYEAAIREELLHCMNPVTKVRKQKIARTTHDFLRPDEVPGFLMAIPDRWRPLFATALYQGLRKGELIGLRKTDVDLESRLLYVQRSYDHDTTKGCHADVIPIAEECVPYLRAAMDTAPGDLVFPRPDGSMHRKDVKLGDIQRRALANAGIVTGYEHRCRRKGCGYKERRSDDGVGDCPRCGFRLWVVPIPRKIRFHDLRHTTASLLTMAGANPAAVQRILRHTDPKITMNTYAHLQPGYLRDEIDRLRFQRKPTEAPEASLTTPTPPTDVGSTSAAPDSTAPPGSAAAQGAPARPTQRSSARADAPTASGRRVTTLLPATRNRASSVSDPQKTALGEPYMQRARHDSPRSIRGSQRCRDARTRGGPGHGAAMNDREAVGAAQQRARHDSNVRPSGSKPDALSN